MGLVGPWPKGMSEAAVNGDQQASNGHRFRTGAEAASIRDSEAKARDTVRHPTVPRRSGRTPLVNSRECLFVGIPLPQSGRLLPEPMSRNDVHVDVRDGNVDKPDHQLQPMGRGESISRAYGALLPVPTPPATTQLQRPGSEVANVLQQNCAGPKEVSRHQWSIDEQPGRCSRSIRKGRRSR